MEKEFILKKQTTVTDESDEKTTLVYHPNDESCEKDVTLTVKGEATAKMLGLPTDMPGDSIIVDFGAINKQTILPSEDDKKEKKKKDKPKKTFKEHEEDDKK